MSSNRVTFVCTEQPNLKFPLVVNNERRRFAFKHGQLLVDDPDEIEAITEQLKMPKMKSFLARFVKRVSLDAAEKMVAEIQSKLPKEIISKGGTTTADVTAARQQNQESAEMKLRAQGLSEEEIAAVAVSLEQENFVVTETIKPAEALNEGEQIKSFDFLAGAKPAVPAA